MKTLKMIIPMLLVLSLALCACGAQPELPQSLGKPLTEEAVPQESAGDPTAEATEPVETEPVATEPVATQPTPTTPAPTQPAATKPVATEPAATEPVATEPVATEPAPKNEFVNYGNNIYEEGVVSIRPRYVYWDGDTLIAECFVINGTSNHLKAVRVDNLAFHNSNGVIADGAFDVLSGVTLAPYNHVVWTFRFRPSEVYQAGGNLSTLRCISDVSFLS